MLSSEIFLTSGDYLIIECDQNSESICNFLIFYKYNNVESASIIENDYTCQNNNYPNLLKFVLFDLI
jgi:hypothetical protein